jgi:hypothetical protein
VKEQIGFDWDQLAETPREILEQDVLEQDVTEAELEYQEEVADPPVEALSQVELEKNGQIPLINIGEWWEEHWKQMPEFVQEDLEPWATVYVHFERREDMEAFAKLVGQRVDLSTKSIWYPEANIDSYKKRRYVS